MDISVLTEQRREMVINLLKGMKIRKSDGEGFDKDDVYASMQQLCDVYEKSIDDLTVSYETEINDLQDKYQKYDENNDLYVSLIMEAKKSSNEIINKAKAEVDEILADGKEQIAAQEEEIEQMKAAAAQEKADLEAELEAAREAAVREKADLAASVEAEKNRVEVIRGQYRDQISVMDQEFEEIKTNILRTAGKIDGLKAQLEEAGKEITWELQDEPAAAGAKDASAEPFEELSFEQLVSKLQQEDAAKAGQAAEVEAPAEPPVVEAEIEAPAEDEGFHFEPVFTDSFEPAAEEPAVKEPELGISEADAPVEETAPEAAEEGLDKIEDLPQEEIKIDLPEETPAEEGEPVEEISFEGLEELFKD